MTFYSKRWAQNNVFSGLQRKGFLLIGVVTFIFISLAFSACGENDQPKESTKHSTVCPSGKPPEKGNHSKNSGELVRYSWTGGVAGYYYRLSIGPDGRSLLRVGPPRFDHAKRFALSHSELNTLREALKNANIRCLPMHDYGPKGPIPDAFVFTATVDGITVIWGDGGKQIPPSLGNLFNLLGKLVRQHSV